MPYLISRIPRRWALLGCASLVLAAPKYGVAQARSEATVSALVATAVAGSGPEAERAIVALGTKAAGGPLGAEAQPLLALVSQLIQDPATSVAVRSAAFRIAARLQVPTGDLNPAAQKAFSLVNQSTLAAGAGAFLASDEARAAAALDGVVEVLQKVDLLDPVHRTAALDIVQAAGARIVPYWETLVGLSGSLSAYPYDLIRLREILAKVGAPAIEPALRSLDDKKAEIRLLAILVLSDMTAVRPETVPQLHGDVMPQVRRLIIDADPAVASAAGSFVRLVSALHQAGIGAPTGPAS